jgi:hypothetical protein
MASGRLRRAAGRTARARPKSAILDKDSREACAIRGRKSVDERNAWLHIQRASNSLKTYFRDETAENSKHMNLSPRPPRAFFLAAFVSRCSVSSKILRDEYFR